MKIQLTFHIKSCVFYMVFNYSIVTKLFFHQHTSLMNFKRVIISLGIASLLKSAPTKY